MFVIKRLPDGAYAAPPGEQHSYTKQLQRARTFGTREAAERELCPENEVVVEVSTEMPKPR